MVLAVPSDDFKLEFGSNAEVKEFFALQYRSSAAAMFDDLT